MTVSITIKMDIAEEIADPSHQSGITVEGHEALIEALEPYGDDIQIERRG